MFVILSVFILCALIGTFLLFRKPSQVSYKNVDDIPCPGGVSILGNIGDIFRSDEELWKLARKRALDCYPIYRQKIFTKSCVFLMDPEDIEIILSDMCSCKKGAYYDPLRKFAGNGLFINYGKTWHNRRKVLTKGFHFSTLAKYISIFNKETSHLVSLLQQKLNEPIDVIFHIQNTIFKITNASVLGKASPLTDKIARDYIDSMKIVSEIMLLKTTKPYLSLMWPLLEVKKKQDDSLNKMHTYVSGAIEANSGPIKERDYLNTLDILVKNPLLFDRQDVLDEVNTFIFGSQDTTSAALSIILMVLANYPQHQDSVYEEIERTLDSNQNPSYSDLSSMDYLDRFIKECLRIYPPFIMMERTLTKEVVTKTGYRLPKGTVVLMSLLDIHRNPNLFPDPEKFDPDRFLSDNVVQMHPFSYLPFSAGPKNCIAKKMAVLVLKASICGIIQNFKLEPGTIIEDIEFSNDVILQVKGGIKLKLIKR